MQIVILLPLLFVFLYCLYKLAKDDYVFIRRNISLEHFFDIAFGTFIISAIISRFFYLFLHAENGKNIIVQFFSASGGSFSLTGGVIGGLLALYLIGKYKRLPFGRIFDFFTLAFLVTLPLGLLLNTLFVPQKEWILHFATLGLYTLFTWIFLQFLYPKLVNRTLKEGMLTILFMMFFSVTSIFLSLVASFPNLMKFFTIQNGILGVLFIFSLVLFFKHERSGRRKGK